MAWSAEMAVGRAVSWTEGFFSDELGLGCRFQAGLGEGVGLRV